MTRSVTIVLDPATETALAKLKDSYRRHMAEQGLPPEALPTDAAFISGAVVGQAALVDEIEEGNEEPYVPAVLH